MGSLPLSITSQLMSLDYQQTETAVACPACVFNELRKKHKDPLDKWEV